MRVVSPWRLPAPSPANRRVLPYRAGRWRNGDTLGNGIDRGCLAAVGVIDIAEGYMQRVGGLRAALPPPRFPEIDAPSGARR
ncbi:hypothetical protein HFO94_07320 [Rhizobium leguminosarum]|uniref:hypothetical protein n=1 Tax=Rhizobium TaxID=379 RepID=UPI00147885D0|nr:MULTISPECIES: hypothetical protein [Rhizobium]MBY5353349.1 hypothetical protein [Rhizobium leguminosarum]NNG70825.1 hypothetical protein [Rhizobium laguerreae]NNH41476.1 hypothetical protein [Rhizobium laguerreae]